MMSFTNTGTTSIKFEELREMDSFREPGKSIPVATSLEKKLLMTIGVLIVIGIGLIIGIIHLKQSANNYEALKPVKYMKSSSEDRDVCFTPTCISEAANLVKSMDTNVDPCTDFYSFVCGNWIKNNYLVSNLESQFLKMAQTIILRVKEILGALELEKNLSSNKKKTADFYKACMDKAYRNELGATEFESDLKKFGGWPLIDETWSSSDFDWSDLMIQLFRNGYINNMIFSLNVYVDIKNTSKTLLKVSQPSLGLYKQRYYIMPDEDILAAYKGIIFMLAELLKDDIDLQSLEDIEEAFEVENSIANVMEYTNMNYPKTFYHIKTLEEIENMAPKVPWRKIFTNFLPPNTSIAKDERIMVTSPTYIEGLNKILEETKPKTLANYMFYRVMLSAANSLDEKFQKLASVLFDTTNVGNPMQWEVCAANTLEFFQLPLTARYVKMYTSNRTKEVLGMMVEDLRKSITHDIVNTDWLDGDTKINAADKIEKMKAAIGYREEIMNDGNLDRYYENVTITDDHFSNIKQLVAFRFRQNMKGLHVKRNGFKWFEEEDLLTANAYYRPTENTITIPVGVLQDTVFAADRPNYINYGSLGMIVGHELTHAFDSIGSLYDAEGNYRNWWSEESWQNFEDKVECYEQQYDNYYVTEADAYVNGRQTLPENIADNGGLKAAYYAYNRLLSRIGSEKSLPGLRYNEKQMFWIAFGSVWCKKQTNDSLQHALKYDVHAPDKYRVIGSLSNMKEFSEDFNCESYSAMDPASKCSLWN